MMNNYVRYRDVWIRKGWRVDQDMVRDCQKHYAHFMFDEDSIVVDFGANIGGFAQMVGESPALEYHGFEPDPDNMTLLAKNTKNFSKSRLLQCVVSNSNEPELTFHQNNSARSACSGSVAPARARPNQTTVRNVHIDNVIRDVQPTHLKMDIEGAELDWLDAHGGKLPDCVQEFALEIHGRYSDMDSMWLPKMKENFEVIHIYPNYGFVNATADHHVYPNMEIDIQGRMFGIDIFMRRYK